MFLSKNSETGETVRRHFASRCRSDASYGFAGNDTSTSPEGIEPFLDDEVTTTLHVRGCVTDLWPVPTHPPLAAIANKG